MIAIVSQVPKKDSQKKENFIFTRQLKLLERALASWPRREAPLLEINCGNGAFLPFFWQCGFDTIATERDEEQRRKALALKLPGLEIYQVTDNALPFDDESFDWVILHIRYKENAALTESMGEALRVAKRGIMLTFWNRSSLPGIWLRLFHKKNAWLENAPSFSQIRHLLAVMQMHSITSFATLWTPDTTWKTGKLCSGLNDRFSFLPFGAWCILRVDFPSGSPVTPLPLRIGGKLAKVEPLLEYAGKPEQAGIWQSARHQSGIRRQASVSNKRDSSKK